MNIAYKYIIDQQDKSTSSVFQIDVRDFGDFNLKRGFSINQKKSELTDHFTSKFDEIKKLKKNRKYFLNFMKITLEEDLEGFVIEFSAIAYDLNELSELISKCFEFPFAITRKTCNENVYIHKNWHFLPINSDRASPGSDGRTSTCSLIYANDSDGNGNGIESLLLLPLKKNTETKKS